MLICGAVAACNETDHIETMTVKKRALREGLMNPPYANT
jgi:hypothetical protein